MVSVPHYNLTMNFLPNTQVLPSLVTPVFLPSFPWHCLGVILYLSQIRRLCCRGELCRPAGGILLQQSCFSIGQNSVRLPRPLSNTSCFSRLSVVTQIFSAHKSPLLEGGFANDGGGSSGSGFPGLPRECCRKINPWPKGLLSGFFHLLSMAPVTRFKIGERITVLEWRLESNFCRRPFSLLLCRSGDQPQVIV